jgi:hypothetical protein
MNKGEIAAFIGYWVLSYFLVGYAVNHDLMPAGRAATLSLGFFFVAILIGRKFAGKK